MAEGQGRALSNPVLVEVTRGGIVESWHRGAIVVVDAQGIRRAAIGDVEATIFPRSAVKAMQALPLVESGAADRYGFGDAELALACSSHNGEPRHVAVASAMLAAAGMSELDLECGPQVPSDPIAADTLLRAGRSPLPIHNNCSGKHAGFICVACHTGVAPRGYVEADHPVQREIAAVMGALTDTALTADNRGIDGCSIPTWAIPMDRLARGFACMATGEGLSPARAAAAARLIDACFAEPFLVAGTGRFDTEALALFSGSAFVKGGAEGVWCGAFPELGLGVAMKCDDGAGRAAEVMMAAVIEAFIPLGGPQRLQFADRLVSPIYSRRGVRVGEIRPVAGLTDALRSGGAVS